MKLNHLFPVLKNHPDLIYFDSAATALKPKTVIDAETHFLTHNSTNPHTNEFPEAFKANEILQQARVKTADFIGGSNPKEIIFNSGTTEGLNQIAFGLIDQIKAGDEIWLTELEHASNLLPWIAVANQKKAKIRMMPLNKSYEIDSKKLGPLLTAKTKIVAFAHATNTIGVVNDVQAIAKVIRHYAPHALIVVDAAQTAAHTPLTVDKWDIDFLSLSVHKMFGPFGLGILWGKLEHLERLKPLVYGGGMLLGLNQDLKHYYPAHLPDRFEGGTRNVQAIATLSTVFDFIKHIGWKKIEQHEQDLKTYLAQQIEQNQLTKHFDFYNYRLNSSTLIFNSKRWPSHEVASWLGNKHHIAVRGGVHCAWLADQLWSAQASVRLSFGIYNTKKEIQQFIKVLKHIDDEMPNFIFEGK